MGVPMSSAHSAIIRKVTPGTRALLSNGRYRRIAKKAIMCRFAGPQNSLQTVERRLDECEELGGRGAGPRERKPQNLARVQVPGRPAEREGGGISWRLKCSANNLTGFHRPRVIAECAADR